MFARLPSLVPLCTVLVAAFACGNNSSNLASPGGSGGQTGSSSSPAGGSNATSVSSSSTSVGGTTQAAGGASDGGASTSSSSTTTSTTTSTGGTVPCVPLRVLQGGAYFASCAALEGGTSNSGTAVGGTTASGTVGGTSASTGTSGSQPAGGGSAGKGATSSAGSGSPGGGGSSSGGASISGGTSSTGGTTSSVCAWDAGPSATNGALTCYWFSQGTSKDETTCPGGYKTYCGYCGGETGSKPSTGTNWCPINDITNTVKNIPTTHFVAIPPGPLGNGKNCGACVEVNYMGRSIVATVIDACPSCTSDQHIDLSLTAAKALGMDEIRGEVKTGSGVTWRIVGCPATSNITVSFNGNYQGQVYFQNLAFPIAKAVSGGKEAPVNTGFWDFGKVMGGQSVTLTDVMGHSITATVPSSPGSLGVQFPLTCQ